MNKFLTFDTNAFRINNSVFPCDSVSFDLQADVAQVYDIDGNFLRTAPNSPINGRCSTQFYLTGEFPGYLRAENQSEAGVRLQFNSFFIPSAYLTDLSFSVAPFQPVLVACSFSFYHGLSVLDTNNTDRHAAFDSRIATSNGLTSYIVTTDRPNYIENPNNFLVTSFDYSFSVDRDPVLRVGQKVPSRVAEKQINIELNASANNLDGRLQIYGNDAIFRAVLRDAQNPSVSSLLYTTGTILNQQYSVSDGELGLAKIKMVQVINRHRSLLSIPFEQENDSLRYDLKEEYAEIPIIDDPVSPPPPNDPPIIVNGNINNGRTYSVVILFRFPFTSTNGSTQTQPCNDEHGYAGSLACVSSFNADGYAFNFSPKDSNTKYVIQPSYEETASLTAYEKEFRAPQYYVGTFTFNEAFLQYINDNIGFTESFPTIEATDDYGNTTNSVCYLFSQGYIKNEDQCEIQPRTLHYITWDQLFAKITTAIGDPNLGNGAAQPYIVKFGFGA